MSTEEKMTEPAVMLHQESAGPGVIAEVVLSQVAAASIQELAPAISAPAVPPTVAIGNDVIGRFTRVELEAMRGKRGRKPSEYHQLFPQEHRGGVVQSAKAGSAAHTLKSLKPQKLEHRGPQAPAVSSAKLGRHTIDELLQMIGTRGAKPVAYTILQQAAQIFAERKALDLSRVMAPDPLAVRLAGAPKQLRVSIELLMDAVQRIR